MTIEALEELFIDQGLPYWRLYAGKGTRGAKRAENADNQDMDESCELLMTRLHQLGPGDYTVVCLTNPSTPDKRGIHHYVRMTGGSLGETQTPQPGGSGYYGMSLQQMMEFAQLLNNQGNANISGAIEAAVDDVRKDFEIQRLKQEVRDLKRGGAREQIIEAGIRRLPEIMDRVLGVPSKQVAGVLGTAGIRETEDEYDGDPAGEKHFSIDQAVNACLAIQELLPDHDVNELLWKLKSYIEQDPEQAVNVLSML